MRSAAPLRTTALWKRPFAEGIAVRVHTLAPPPDCPMIVTLPGSPPNAAMLSRTHSRAATMSSMPTLPGRGEPLAARAGQIAEAQGAQAVVDGAEHDVAEAREVLAVVAVLLDAVAVGEAAPVDPEHDGPLLPVLQRRREDVDPQAVFADVVVVPVVPERGELVRVSVLHHLRRRVPPPQCGEDVRPGLRLLRGHEPVGAGRVGSVGDAEEVVDAPQHVPPDLAVLSLRDGDVVADEQDRSVFGLWCGAGSAGGRDTLRPKSQAGSARAHRPKEPSPGRFHSDSPLIMMGHGPECSLADRTPLWSARDRSARWRWGQGSRLLDTRRVSLANPPPPGPVVD